MSNPEGRPESTAVGAPIERVDARAKVTGTAAYVDDLCFPGMLEGALVLPGTPHAHFLGVDSEEALGIAGVRAVLTAADVPGENQVGVVEADQPLLPFDRIRYTGDAVAVVVAETRAAAREGAARVRVRVEELPAVFDAVEAMGEGAPAVHEGGNVFLHFVVRKGDVDAGFSEADVVIERTFRTHHQEHAYLEPLGAIAVPELGGGMTIYGTMQCPYYVQKAVARILGVSLASVRVVQTVTGGGFGGKEDVPNEICALAAVGASATGRPVKLIHSREEDFYRSSKRHPAVVTIKLGARKDGAFTAARAEIIGDAGAYSTLTPIVLFRSTVHATGPYEIPNVSTDTYGVYTNRQTSGAFRGFGQPQTIFANESVVDEMASALGIDPIELRRRNALDVGKRTATDQLLTESVGLLKTIDAAERASGWNAAAAQGATASAGNAPTMRRGIGAASIYYGVSLGAKGLPLDGSGAHMNIYQDGSVRIAIGGSEMGQGLHTVLAQIAADALGASVASIRVDHVDTSIVPDSGPSVASRTTLMTGNAVLDAAGKLRERIARVAADMLECDPASLEFSGGRISSGSASVEFADVARECWARNVNTAAEGWYAAPETTFDENGLGNAYAVYSFATHVAEVEVDTETGQIHLLRVTAAHDVGRILNPVTLEGQIEGGVLQGAGMALYERMKTTAGRIDTPDFSTYILPTSVDVPEIRTIFVEEPYSAGPFGAKGIGETPLMPCPAAIANAVANALGMRFDELPITPEDVMRVLAEGESARCDS